MTANFSIMKKCLAFMLLAIISVQGYGQKAIFLHHSTGGYLYEQGNVAQWISNYNSQHGTNYQLSERAYPDTPYPWANYPFDYWNLWINNQCNNSNPNIECLDKLTQSYDVIIFKHCFPGASVQADYGSPLISSSVQTLANYKLQYRALRALMDSYPSKKFILWTLVPLHRLETTPENAARAREFVNWVKSSWLTEDGQAHPNIYIFDFFGYAAENNPTPINGQINCLKYDYEISHTNIDSHPNVAANQTIGPIFAEFIVNTIRSTTNSIETAYSKNLIKVYPNPASDKITIDMSETDYLNSSIEIVDFTGRMLTQRSDISHPVVVVSTDKLINGQYFVKSRIGGKFYISRFSVMK
jgi:hypothetical protein